MEDKKQWIKIIIFCFFLFLILFPFCDSFLYNFFITPRRITIQEGLNATYEDYNWQKMPSDSMQLAQQNARNISYLKEQLDTTTLFQQEIEDLSGNMATLTQQMQDLVNAQKSYAEDNLPQDPPEISGL